MYRLLTIFLFLLNIYKCFKIKSLKKLCEPFYLNLVKRNIIFYKNNKITNTFFVLKNKAREENESNIFDKSYVYHKPVLLDEVLEYLNKNELYNQIKGNINHDITVLELNSIVSNKNTTNINKSEDIFNKEKCIINERENFKDMKISNLKNCNSINPFNLNKETINKNSKEEINLYIDATLGGGGHTLEIIKKIKNSKVIAIDKDIESIYYNKLKLKEYIDKNKLTLIHGNYRNVLHLLNYHSLPLSNYSGILIDLGVSSHQLKSSKRGFSYKYDGVLDMNMNKYSEQEYKNLYFSNNNYNITVDNNTSNMNSKIHHILNKYSLKKLKFIIETFGEEKKSLKIAKKIVQWRKNNGNIRTTYDLKHIILSTCKKNYRTNNKVLSRVFQSFRIYINDELKALKELLISAHKILKPGRRLIIITYHSLEDMCIERIIEKRKELWTKINKNAITPRENEIKSNNSSRSAKMFVFEKK